jgi:hypothetical protein
MIIKVSINHPDEILKALVERRSSRIDKKETIEDITQAVVTRAFKHLVEEHQDLENREIIANLNKMPVSGRAALLRSIK